MKKTLLLLAAVGLLAAGCSGSKYSERSQNPPPSGQQTTSPKVQGTSDPDAIVNDLENGVSEEEKLDTESDSDITNSDQDIINGYSDVYDEKSF